MKGVYVHFLDARGDGGRHATRGPFAFAQLTYGLLRVDEDTELASFALGVWQLLPDDGRRGYTDVVISTSPDSGIPGEES